MVFDFLDWVLCTNTSISHITYHNEHYQQNFSSTFCRSPIDFDSDVEPAAPCPAPAALPRPRARRARGSACISFSACYSCWLTVECAVCRRRLALRGAAAGPGACAARAMLWRANECLPPWCSVQQPHTCCYIPRARRPWRLRTRLLAHSPAHPQANALHAHTREHAARGRGLRQFISESSSLAAPLSRCPPLQHIHVYLLICGSPGKPPIRTLHPTHSSSSPHIALLPYLCMPPLTHARAHAPVTARPRS